MTADAGTETIAAVATPPGVGGIGIVRVSGPLAPRIAEAMLGGLPPPRRAVRRRFLDADGAPLDEGLALYFPGPGSYTGEDVLELHGHGGPVVLDRVLARALALGARPARPGEFTERAFLNGRLDLAQAEAVADLIEAASAEAARAALRSLEGALSREARALGERLAGLRVQLEATLDFPDEDIDAAGEATLAAGLAEARAQLDSLLAGATRGRALREGLTVVIAGRPNVGKSSLLNALAGCEAAIVTDVPGTTRDVLRERVLAHGVPVHVVDTAGLREARDPVEREGVRRAREQAARADRVLLVVDDTAGWTPEDAAAQAALPRETPVTVVLNKIDLSGRAPGPVAGHPVGTHAFAISARTGAGLEALRSHLAETAGLAAGRAEGVWMARRRHLDALERAGRHLEEAAAELAAGRAELAAEGLRLAHRAVGEITGEFTTEELLGRIFSTFCIGK